MPKHKKHKILENDEFYIEAKFQDNWLKNQKVIHTVDLLASSVPAIIHFIEDHVWKLRSFREKQSFFE